MIWTTVDIICCLTSSYLCAYMAAFENPHVGHILFDLLYAHETIFLISMILRFFVDYQNEGDVRPVRDIIKIGKRYLDTKFRYDLIPLIPLQLIPLPHGYARLFLIIKIIRLVNGFQLFQVRKFMLVIRGFYDKKVQNIIKNDPILAENTIEDNNNISILLSINNLLKISKLVLIIFSISYFLGFFVQIVSELGYDYQEYTLSDLKQNMTEIEFKEWAQPYNMVTFFEKYGMLYVDDPQLNEE